MTKTKIAFSIAAFFVVCLLSLTNNFAQTPPTKNQIEPSYEVILQTLVGSNNSGSKTEIPQTLSGAIKKLKANYSYSNYRLTSTYLQRIANTGTIEFKAFSSTADAASQDTINTPSFSDWTLTNLQSLSNAKGQNLIQFQNFRFGQRIPLVISTAKDESGKTNSVINYETVGLTLQKFSLLENTPTIIGSLTASKPDELMFLILTVKSAEE